MITAGTLLHVFNVKGLKGQRSRSHGLSISRIFAPYKKSGSAFQRRCHCRNFDPQFGNSSFCECAMQSWPKHW